MKNDVYYINYPSIFCGTDKSEIHFEKGTPDLVSVFKPGDTAENRRFFVTDATVASLPCMSEFISKFDDNVCGQDLLIVLGSGEPYKTIETVLTIIQTALEAGFTRNDTFVGIGGGVICDTTSFAASIFKRGASVQLVPTTLLAMVDASIGGKTGVDFAKYKNMIGTFFPAQKLFYFPEFIQSLSDTQYKSGLAEAIKTAILFDKELYDIFKNNPEQIKKRDKELLDVIITKSVQAKASVVEKDFTEKNIRATLNLGHTFGHAFESVAGLGAVTHGEAVAWGIGRAVCVSCNKEYCREDFKNEILELLSLYDFETSPLPSVISGGGVGDRLLSAMHKDKKNINNKVRAIIPKAVDDIVIEEIEDSEILQVLK
ncbi:MAG: 3-dehydroquinate synthase family protein [Treponema sp.]|nr:3-dehydroquinate synthase [Spirochaetia bacterium]MDY2840381.1 3-dehydroquinate synthase family protein [Treponema sp.]